MKSDNIGSEIIDDIDGRRYNSLCMKLGREEPAVLGLSESFVADLLQLNLLPRSILDDRNEWRGVNISVRILTSLPATPESN